MPPPENLSLRTATLDDLPAIAAMRLEVGWAVHDWALRLAIEPENARCFAVTDASGRLIAAGSGVAYPPLGIVGNMVVAATHRRRGIGSAVLEKVAEFLAAAGCTRLELYASDDGRPLYARNGFSFTEPGSHARLPRDLQLADDDGIEVADAGSSDLERLVAYDTPRFGGERTALLRAMLSDAGRPVLFATRDGAIVGFAWLRADGDRIGPWVADDPEAAAALLREAFRLLPDRAELTTNITMANAPGVDWLRGMGVEPDPWDGHMARGAPIARRDETIYGNTVGALG